jgi:hypothetical protein
LSKRRATAGHHTVRGERRWPVGALLVGGILLAVLVAFVAVVVMDTQQQAARTPPNGVESVDVGPGGQHTGGIVDYAQTPPVGGEHNPVWQNCGYYNKPVTNENAVHSLEHGAVWITYRPDLPRDEVDQLRELAQGQSYVLVSPYPDLPAPVAASAWGKQLRMDSAKDPRLEQFTSAYQQGPQTPEPGAACSGGVGEPA